MTDLTPIPTPWRRRLVILRLRLLPLLGFFCCVLIVAGIWHRKLGVSAGVGEVLPTEYDAIAALDRRLVDLPGPAKIKLFQAVEKGAVVARLDDQKTLQAIEVAQLEVTRLAKEVDALVEQQKLDGYDRLDVVQRIRERRMREIRPLDLRMQVLQNRIQLRADQELRGAQQEEYDLTHEALDEGAVAELALIRIKGELAATEARIANSLEFEKELRDQLSEANEAKTRLADEILEIDVALHALVAPIQAAIEKQQAVVTQLELELEDLDIRSPIDGVITAIHKRASQFVLPGDPIVTVTGTDSEWIVFYIRDGMDVDPQINQPVRVRPRQKGAEFVDSVIAEIGPRHQAVPIEMLSDPTVPEWAHPIFIRRPADLPLRPGERVDVEF